MTIFLLNRGDACIWHVPTSSCMSHHFVRPFAEAEAEATAAAVGGRKWKLKSEIAVDSELMSLLHRDLVGDERIAAHEFFLTLAACNTVIPILTHSPSSCCTESQRHEDVEAIDYQGESPDEQALVSAASAYGYTLFERTSGHIVIDVNGEKQR